MLCAKMTYAELKKLADEKYGEPGEYETVHVWPKDSIDPGSWDKYCAEMENLLMQDLPKAQFDMERDRLFGKYGMCVD